MAPNESNPASATVSKTGGGPPVLYLHGAFGHTFRPASVDRLSDQFTVYAPVHPGFEDANTADGLEDVLDLVLYHVDLMDHLGVETADLVGHFFGAMIAAEIAAIRPDRVRRLVLASPGGLWVEDEPNLDYFATPVPALRGAIFSDADSEIAQSILPDVGPDNRIAAEIVRVQSLGTTAKFLWPIPDRGLSRRLSRIKAPTLIVTGEDDPIASPGYGRFARELIADSRLEIVPNANHMIPFEQADRFSDLVLSFLSE